MAENHWKFNDQTNAGRKLRGPINKLKEARDEINIVYATMQNLKEAGVVTSALQTEYGCPTLGDAEGMVGELEALKGELDSIAATIDQANARLGT
jgi:hypothetical protein